MNRSYILIVGIAISLIAVLFLVIDNDLEVKNINIKETQAKLKEKSKDNHIEINYESSEIINDDTELSQQQMAKQTREPFLEANAYDKSKKFEIALINPNQDLSKERRGHTTLQGTIDGSSFFLDVPKSLIEEGSGDTQLRIKNLETGEVTSVTAAFIDDMRNPKNKQKISIDSKDVQNYQQEEVEQIVPLRPGELRE